ncbi:MAG: hypothetical protein M1835_005282 [Candelina submexicana]|nr:MAG: hypothetical protein M1835_005282 [Candelina submexicana]
MSFLNSVLSSIGEGGQSSLSGPLNRGSNTIGTVSVQEPAKKNTSTNGARQTDVGLGSGQKRKAEEELNRVTGKVARSDVTTCAQTARPQAQPRRIRTSVTGNSSTVSPSTPNSASPYRGTAKPSTGTSLVSSDAGTPKAPPKKGSYAEIMARGQVAQSNKAQVGIIKHKPVEKLSKKERLALRAGTSAKKVEGSKAGKDAMNERCKGSVPTGKKEDDKVVKRRPPVELSYKGTARSKPDVPAYRGTMNRPAPKPNKPSSDNRYSDRSRSTSVARQAPKSRYADYTDKDEEEEEEEDYDSEGSSDMEAPIHEVDKEEEIAELAAKKEDLQEAMEEARLKRQKEERKKNLALLAKKKRR